MARYRLDLEYEGTRYRGWQEQKNARTVAGELRRAIEARHGPVIEIGGAGRTDAGVHALHQVAHVEMPGIIDPREFARALNAELASDVHVLAAAVAPPRFHARHAALSRSYVYRIAKRRSAFEKRHSWTIESPLDVEALRAASQRLVGRRDFALLCDARLERGKSTIVLVESVEVVESPDLVCVRLEASHFLWRMVRRTVGALVKVGTRAIDARAFDGILAGEAPDASLGAISEWSAPACGLFLERVRYPGDPPLGPLRAPALFGVGFTAPA